MLGIVAAVVGVQGCASAPEQAIVTQGARVPWLNSDAYLERVGTPDSVCYVLIRRVGEAAIGVSCVRVEDQAILESLRR